MWFDNHFDILVVLPDPGKVLIESVNIGSRVLLSESQSINTSAMEYNTFQLGIHNFPRQLGLIMAHGIN